MAISKINKSQILKNNKYVNGIKFPVGSIIHYDNHGLPEWAWVGGEMVIDKSRCAGDMGQSWTRHPYAHSLLLNLEKRDKIYFDTEGKITGVEVWA